MTFKWDPRAQRYRDGRGRFVPRTQVVGALEKTLEKTRRRLQEVALDLRAGNLTVGRWQQATRALVKDLHLYSGALAKGGWDQMSPADWGRLGPRLKAQYQYLDRFAAQVASGEVPLDGRFLQRVDLYGQSGRGTYWKTRGKAQEEGGATEEQSILNPADHCEECLSEAARGWVPIGTLVPIGERICKANCKCEFEYR